MDELPGELLRFELGDYYFLYRPRLLQRIQGPAVEMVNIGRRAKVEDFISDRRSVKFVLLALTNSYKHGMSSQIFRRLQSLDYDVSVISKVEALEYLSVVTMHFSRKT